MYQIYNPTKYANENRLKVVTCNVHSFGNEITGFSAKEFAEMMNKEETDVLCFQEYRGNGDTLLEFSELMGLYFTPFEKRRYKKHI